MFCHYIILIGFGNPVIDINVNVTDLTDTKIVEKHNLKLDSQNGVTEEVAQAVEEEVASKNYPKSNCAGGCTQNTLRIFQWLERKDFQTMMFGAVGSDEYSKILENQLHEEKVLARYATIPKKKTTKDIILIHQKYRTILYADTEQNADAHFTKASSEYIAHAFDQIEYAKFCITEVFFTNHSSEFMVEAFARCKRYYIRRVFSLSGETLVRSSSFEKTVLPFVSETDILAGNRQEYDALFDMLGISITNYEKAIRTLYKMMTKGDASSWKIILITDDERPIHCFTKGDYFLFPVPPISPGVILDTTGAGDAFLAGFLYGIHHHKELIRCLELGCETAAEIIQQPGVRIPAQVPTFQEN